jgi:hypothetical protein
MIPKRIVQIWNDERIEDAIPGLQAAVATWKTLNPDYEHVYYSMKTARQFIADNYEADVLGAFDILVPGAYKADLFRYCELYKNGGFYVDIKMNCKIPLDHIMCENMFAENLFVLDSYKSGSGLLNGFFGIIPNSPLLLLAIQRCVRTVNDRYYGINPLDTTGPLMFGRCFREWKGHSASLTDCSEFYGKGEDTIWCKLNVVVVVDGKWHIVSQSNNIIIDNNTPGYSDLTSPRHYSVLWENRIIYTDSLPKEPKIGKRPPNHMFLPRALRR